MNKFNLRDNVRFEMFECSITDINYRDVGNTINRGTVREYTYDLCASIDGNIITINGVLGKHLELIEQDTKEETPTEKCCDETVVPDYNPKEDLLNRIIVIAAAGINDDRLFEECLKGIISQYEISELI